MNSLGWFLAKCKVTVITPPNPRPWSQSGRRSGCSKGRTLSIPALLYWCAGVMSNVIPLQASGLRDGVRSSKKRCCSLRCCSLVSEVAQRNAGAEPEEGSWEEGGTFEFSPRDMDPDTLSQLRLHLLIILVINYSINSSDKKYFLY